MGYARRELLAKVEEAAQDMGTFYKQPFVNYRGRCSDDQVLYTEVVAEWLLDHLDLMDAVPQITRENSYRTEGHDGNPRSSDSNRTEELIAMELFRQRDLPGAGIVIDYQTPLKNSRGDEAGKIDLLSVDDDAVRILELKKPDSDETMLRCVLEGETYRRTANLEKLLDDFGIDQGAVVTANPLVFSEGVQHQEFREGRPMLRELMKRLNCEPYFLAKAPDGTYTAEEGEL